MRTFSLPWGILGWIGVVLLAILVPAYAATSGFWVHVLIWFGILAATELLRADALRQARRRPSSRRPR
jgi:hypothetical protein